jgi:hypothetical protein
MTRNSPPEAPAALVSLLELKGMSYVRARRSSSSRPPERGRSARSAARPAVEKLLMMNSLYPEFRCESKALRQRVAQVDAGGAGGLRRSFVHAR